MAEDWTIMPVLDVCVNLLKLFSPASKPCRNGMACWKKSKIGSLGYVGGILGSVEEEGDVRMSIVTTYQLHEKSKIGPGS